MPDTHSYWRTDCPTVGAPPGDRPDLYLPDGYLPRYPYPLLMVFGGPPAGRLLPQMSRRNFVGVSVSAADADPADAVRTALVAVRRVCHVHTERVYVVGIGDGCGDAYRAALPLAGQVAGVAALGGTTPTDRRPLLPFRSGKDLRVLISHGRDQAARADRDHRLFYAAGADVSVYRHPTAAAFHPDMLRDLNRWVMGHVNADHGLLARR
jgi:phospholipase/carboxylesterase